MDDDICVILTAGTVRSEQAFALPANRHLYRVVSTAEGGNPDHHGDVGSRDPTPAPDATEKLLHQLVLRFSCPPKDPSMGWSFGRDSSCDVVLSDRSIELSSYVSSRHFYIYVSKESHLFLHDRSTHGVAVGYGNVHLDEIRNEETWLISRGGPERPLASVVSVVFRNGIEFSLEMPRSDAKRVALYELSQNALPPLNALGLDSGRTTARPSRPETPRASGLRPALYLFLRRIGSGAFGYVDEVINLRDGTLAARKQLRAFVPKEQNKRKYNKSITQFENEVELMRTVEHANVMQVINIALAPQPTLYMPFFEAGSMEDHRDELSDEQTVCILRQLLIGTAYLHQKNIIHRDLKPANVLLDLSENRIRAVITDLGLSKMLTDVDTATFCGTPIYMAPEVGSQRYGPQVDEYAIGIMAMEFVYGLKKVTYLPGSAQWTKAQREKVEDLDDDKLSKIIIGLTDQQPRTRLTADASLDLGCEEGLWKKENEVVVDTEEVEATGLTLRQQSLTPNTSDGLKTELETIEAASAITVRTTAIPPRPPTTDSRSHRSLNTSNRPASIQISQLDAPKPLKTTASVQDTDPNPSLP